MPHRAEEPTLAIQPHIVVSLLSCCLFASLKSAMITLPPDLRLLPRHPVHHEPLHLLVVFVHDPAVPVQIISSPEYAEVRLPSAPVRRIRDLQAFIHLPRILLRGILDIHEVRLIGRQPGQRSYDSLVIRPSAPVYAVFVRIGYALVGKVYV